MPYGLLQLGRLFLEIRPGAAPFLAGVRRHLATVDGEHLLADQPQIVADQQHISEQVDDFLVHGGDEIGNGGEMGPGVGGQGHEDHILPAGLLDLPAGDNAPRVTIEHNLQKNPGIIGSGAGLIIAEAGVEQGKVKLVVDEVIQGVFEGAGQDLLGEVDGDELALGV